MTRRKKTALWDPGRLTAPCAKWIGTKRFRVVETKIGMVYCKSGQVAGAANFCRLGGYAMKAKRFAIFVGILALFFTVALSAANANMQEDVERAAAIIERFEEIPENAIPPWVMRDAKGLAILTVTKVGFIISGRGGSGVVVARTETGWSGPLAIGTGGLGVGFQAGVQVTEHVIVLNTQEAVKAFSQGGNVTLGANLSVAVGPVGRTAEAGVAPQAAVYTYSRSQGVFAGISLEGTIIGTRYRKNEEYYNKPVYPSEILEGKVAPPPGAQKLLNILAKY
jgi:SH3 domain-containing YSC84-like protein 1